MALDICYFSHSIEFSDMQLPESTILGYSEMIFKMSSKPYYKSAVSLVLSI